MVLLNPQSTVVGNSRAETPAATVHATVTRRISHLPRSENPEQFL